MMIDAQHYPKKEPVYIIIPVYNRKQITLNCLEKLQLSGDIKKYHIVVVDDGSTDGTGEEINSLYPEVTVLRGDGNLWWTGAMAVGMHYACEQEAEYIFWLNDDCTPDDNTISGLVSFMQAHPDTITAPACFAGEPDNLVQMHTGFKGRTGNLPKPGDVFYVDGLSGRCVGIPTSVFRKIGPPDDRKFPHYSGDDMYVLKATRAGFKACVVGDYKVTLVGEVNETLDFRRYVRPGINPIATFQALFWHKKSPYRLPTQYYYLTEKYGFFLGILLFSSKISFWVWQWLQLQFSVFIKASNQAKA
jgi:glycosyltransferase involved in cell wall biosynthesis